MIIDGLAQRGYAIVPDALPPSVVAGLRTRMRGLDLEPARMGRGHTRREQTAVRGDRIAWIAESPQADAEVLLMTWLDGVREACNRELMLGLVDFEGHYAAYAPGAHYARHRDRLRDDDTRVLSCVLYLNDAWQPRDGGALRLYLGNGEAVDVLPEAGTFVAFLAADFDHEVCPAARERLSVTGWFRRRALAARA